MKLKKNAAPFDQLQLQPQQFVGQTQPNRQKRAVWFSFFVCFSQTTQCILSVYTMRTQCVHCQYIHIHNSLSVQQSARHDRRCDTMGTTAPPPAAESIMYISSHHLFTNCLLLRLGYRILPWVTICSPGLPHWVTVGYRPVYRIYQVYQNCVSRFTRFIEPVC